MTLSAALLLPFGKPRIFALGPDAWVDEDLLEHLILLCHAILEARLAECVGEGYDSNQ